MGGKVTNRAAHFFYVETLMPRITVPLNAAEKEALRRLAERELREPRAQAALILRRELQRCGLLGIEEGREQDPQDVSDASTRS